MEGEDSLSAVPQQAFATATKEIQEWQAPTVATGTAPTSKYSRSRTNVIRRDPRSIPSAGRLATWALRGFPLPNARPEEFSTLPSDLPTSKTGEDGPVECGTMTEAMHSALAGSGHPNQWRLCCPDDLTQAHYVDRSLLWMSGTETVRFDSVPGGTIVDLGENGPSNCRSFSPVEYLEVQEMQVEETSALHYECP